MATAEPVQDSGTSKPTVKGLMPPYRVLHDFLDGATAAALLAYAQTRENTFKPTRVIDRDRDLESVRVKEKHVPSIRMSVATHELSDFRPLLATKVLGLVPELVRTLRMTPFETGPLELQLVAHGDGAFFKRHIDTQSAATGPDDIRMLSGIYYLHATPKGFDGGALRLYAIGSPDFVDIPPEHNTFLAFPSWAPHEVMPVHCPSRRFSDSRFAINCWVYRKKAAEGDKT